MYVYEIVEKLKVSTELKMRIEEIIQQDDTYSLELQEYLQTIYKAEKRLSFNTNIEINPKLMLGLSYDYSLDPALNYFHGSWELVLRYEWRKTINSNIPFYY